MKAEITCNWLMKIGKIREIKFPKIHSGMFWQNFPRFISGKFPKMMIGIGLWSKTSNSESLYFVVAVQFPGRTALRSRGQKRNKVPALFYKMMLHFFMKIRLYSSTLYLLFHPKGQERPPWQLRAKRSHQTHHNHKKPQGLHQFRLTPQSTVVRITIFLSILYLSHVHSTLREF
jgi:hypothetical protein